MLIRFASEKDLPAWHALATEVSPIFRHPADMGTDPEFVAYTKSKSSKYEALIAVDYMSGNNMGFIGLSRTHNRITWFGVTEKYRNKGVGSRLLKTALRHLDHTKPITVETYPEGYEPGVPAKNLYRKFGFVETESSLTGPFNLPICRMTVDLSSEKRGSSFYYRYPEFIKASHEEKCPICNDEPRFSKEVHILNAYKADPCGTLSIPYWKHKRITHPNDMIVVHNSDFLNELLEKYNDDMYFRLFHSLTDVKTPILASEYRVGTLHTDRSIKLLSHHINKCYENIYIDEITLSQQLNNHFYPDNLKIGIFEVNTDKLIASGVAAFDSEIGEGSLEWIQVSPEYRRVGLGQVIVNELLVRLKSKAFFTTVSGRVDNITNPERLYRKCGFTGDDIWHILKERN